MKMHWWRLLVAPVAVALVVVGGCVAAGGPDTPSGSTAVVVPPSPSPSSSRVSAARAGGPVVGVVSNDSVATDLARLDPRTLRPLPGDRLRLEGSWPMLAVAPDRSTAVLGSEVGQDREIPSGLELIDTATWTARRVDRHSGSAKLAAGRLLAFGAAFGTGPNGANQGYGLTVYGPGDRRPIHLLGAKQVSWIQVNGDLAYVQLMDANLSNVDGYAVLDLRSGRVLHNGAGNVPDVLVPDRE